MVTAGALISLRVVLASPEDRLTDVATRMKASGAHHCVVAEGMGRHFVGLVRLADVAHYAHGGNRILADLVAPVQPVRVHASEPAQAIADLFVQHRLSEAVVVDDAERYVGLATAESVLEWAVGELKRDADTCGGNVAPRDSPASGRLPPAQRIRKPAAGASGDATLDETEILLVEDHVPSRIAMAHLLRRKGRRVTAVGSVSEALAAAERKPFALVISDIGLPDGTGYQLMRLLRERHGSRGIAMSGYEMEGDGKASRAAGFVTYLTKPVIAWRLEQALVIAAYSARQTGVSRNPGSGT